MKRMIKEMLLFSILFSCGCMRSHQMESPTPPATPYVVHTVAHSGETLSGIAYDYTGKSENWRAIRAFNNGLDARKIQIGTQIKIPKDMVVRRVKERPAAKRRAASPAIDPLSKKDAAVVATLKEENLPATQANAAPEVAKVEADLPRGEATPSEVTQLGAPAIAPLAVAEAPTSVTNGQAMTDQSSIMKDTVAEKSSSDDKNDAAAAPAGDTQKSKEQLLKELMEDY